MPRLIAPILAFALGLGAAFAIVSCGESDKGLLPGDTAGQIGANLEDVEQQVAEGNCAEAEQSAQEVARQVDGLGPEVSSRLRLALADGAARLEQVAVSDCTETTEDTEAVTQEPLTDEEPPTDETDEEPTTEPESTDSTPTEPPPEEPPPTETPPPPPDDGGGSGGIGPGAGSEESD